MPFDSIKQLIVAVPGISISEEEVSSYLSLIQSKDISVVETFLGPSNAGIVKVVLYVTFTVYRVGLSLTAA